MSEKELVAELRRLILRAAPDPGAARPVETCGADRPLDEVIPFSSLIVLGTVVAIEHRFGIEVTRRDLRAVGSRGLTLSQLAALIRDRCPFSVEE